MHTTTGVFVCFEGGEGAGKSTQARVLATSLEERRYAVLLTFEPGGTPTGQLIRHIVLDPGTGDLAHRAEALLFAADKAEHVDTVVMPALERGEVVITDRYVDTSLAYQGHARDLEFGDVEWINRWATRDLRPHLTVVLDGEPAVGLGRFEGRDRIEAESLEFFHVARTAFLDLAAADPDHYLVLDAGRRVDEIAGLVLERVEPLLGQAVR